jgi:hypothetical protein
VLTPSIATANTIAGSMGEGAGLSEPCGSALTLK